MGLGHVNAKDMYVGGFYHLFINVPLSTPRIV